MRNLTYIKRLDSLIPSLLKISICPSFPKYMDLDPHSLFFLDGDLDPNNRDSSDLKNKYPTVEVMEEFLSDQFNTLHTPKEYVEADKLYTIDELNKKIIKHNSTLKMPGKGEFLMEKAAFIKWHGYNTPTAKDVSITPLFGTFFPFVDLKDKSARSIYSQWKISSYMLIWEYNILNKAIKYMEELDSSISLPSVYRDCFQYWKNRQINLNLENPELFSLEIYLMDFTLDKDHLYREICEDFLYVMLNIILAKTIVENFNINSVNNDAEFYSNMESIIKVHYLNHEEGYICLDSIRKYVAENYISEFHLKSILREL